MSTFCHLLMAVFTIISIPLVIPLFHFLFSTRPDKTEVPDSFLDIIGWLEYYFMHLLETAGAEKTLMLTCLFILLTIFLKNLFRYLALYFMVPVRSSVARDLRSKLYSGFVHTSGITTNKLNRGDLLTRISSDVQEIEWNMLRFIDTVIKSPIIIVGAVFLMLSISVKLSIFVVILMIFTGLVIGTLSRRLKRQSEELQSNLSLITHNVDETLDGALHIRVYRVIQNWIDKFEIINNLYRKSFNKVTRRQELSSPLSEFLGIAVVVALLWFGAQLVMKSELRAESFFAFVLAFYHVIEPLKSFSTAYYYLKRGSASLDRIESSLDLHKKEDNFAGKEFSFESEINFDRLYYAYEEKDVLSGLSLNIKKAEKIALVGASGAGKSTIVRLLLGTLKAREGNLTIDGVKISDINRDSLYRNIAYVSQDSFLFDDTVRNNLLMGRSASDERIWQCLRMAFADDFVQNLPEKLNTRIGERGNHLSGGEKQRLTIARALLEDPQILILDEPTSALDPESESVVSKAVINVLEDRTALIIAHRLSTIKSVNNIFVLDEGRVVEEGTHDELVQKQGIYAQYVDIQSID